MTISASDVIPLSQARANFSELAEDVKGGAEKLITKAKKAQDGDATSIHRIRQIQGYLGDKEMTHKLVAEVAPRYLERNGGYLRILKLGPRQGDNAPMARIELV